MKKATNVKKNAKKKKKTNSTKKVEQVNFEFIDSQIMKALGNEFYNPEIDKTQLCVNAEELLRITDLYGEDATFASFQRLMEKGLVDPRMFSAEISEPTEFERSQR